MDALAAYDASAGARARSGGMLTPSVWRGCDATTRATLHTFYRGAYLYARAAVHVLRRLRALPAEERRLRWNGRPRRAADGRMRLRPTAPAYWFGPYSDQRLDAIASLYGRVLGRFEQGYSSDGERRRVRFQCLSANKPKCRGTVLANASIYGTVRVCPRLLSKRPAAGATVVLHEMFHQGLGIRDQRDAICRVGRETRCYGRGARALVRAGRLGKAMRNNDNYAYFARMAYAVVRRRKQRRQQQTSEMSARGRVG